MNATGMSRMKTVGKVLAGLEPKTHNALVAALSPRASPVERWGTDLSPYPAVVAARIESLQTGDLVVTSSGAGISWVGNALQVLTDSTWNHVAMVVRGYMTADTEEEQAKHGDAIVHSAQPKRFAKHRDRTPFHFHVDCDQGSPHLFEASGEGVHIYTDIEEQLLRSKAYEEYTTVAVRALNGVDRTPEAMRELEDWIARARGTEFEKEAPLHSLFDDSAGDIDSMHCAELTTATLQAMGLISPKFVAGRAPPCAYADAPHGAVKLRTGYFGPMEIIKAEEPRLEDAISKYESL